jgi:hypothetical protein
MTINWLVLKMSLTFALYALGECSSLHRPQMSPFIPLPGKVNGRSEEEVVRSPHSSKAINWLFPNN